MSTLESLVGSRCAHAFTPYSAGHAGYPLVWCDAQRSSKSNGVLPQMRQRLCGCADSIGGNLE